MSENIKYADTTQEEKICEHIAKFDKTVKKKLKKENNENKIKPHKIFKNYKKVK